MKQMSTVELFRHPNLQEGRAKNSIGASASTRTRGIMSEVTQYGVSDVRLVLESDVGEGQKEVTIEYIVVKNGIPVEPEWIYVGSYFCHARSGDGRSITYCHVFEHPERKLVVYRR